MRFLPALAWVVTGAILLGKPAAGWAAGQAYEPVSFLAGEWVEPLTSSDDTVLKLTFDAAGKPVVVPAGLKATMVGSMTALPVARDLPGFSGAVRIAGPAGAAEGAEAEAEEAAPKGKGKGKGKMMKGGRGKTPTTYVEVVEGAALLGQGAFTMDVILRFSMGDGNFVEAGPEAAFQWGLLDRDAGTLVVRLPGGEKGFNISTPAMLEKVGPLARDHFQRLTLTYDGEGTVVFYVDGTECDRQKVEGLTGALPLTQGPLRVGDVTPSKSRFFGDLAEVRVQKGVHVPEAPKAKPVASGGTAGWAFDMGTSDSPVAPGYQRVTEADVFGGGKTYGFTAKPVGSKDFWFVGERYSAEPSRVIKDGTRRPRAWQWRDFVLVPSGEGFDAKIVPGTYVVTVTVGRTDVRQFVEKVEVNGAVIGKDLNTLPDLQVDSDDRTARAIVQVGNDGMLKVRVFSTATDGAAAQPVGIMAVTAVPMSPLPVAREGDKLIWKGSGTAPAGFDKAAQAYAAKDYAGAFAAAGEITDVLARSATRAWIVGYPSLTNVTTLDWLKVIDDDLLTYLRAHPEDLAARYLEEQTMLLWHAVEAYLYQRGTTRIYGSSKGRAWREGANLAFQIQPGEPYYGQARLLGGNFIWQYGQQAGGYLNESTWRVASKHLGYLPPPPIFREVLAAYPDATLPKVLLSNNLILSEGAAGQTTAQAEGRVPARPIAEPPNAPEWAVLQHRATTRLIDVVNYWFTQRMGPDGTMGGGFGDDVEMLRWWKTAYFVAGSENVREGWDRLARTGWKSMHGNPMPDVQQDAEHVVENYTDSHGLQPMLHVDDDEFSTYMDRSRMLVPILKDVLMERDEKGYLVFKNYRYSRLNAVSGGADVPYNLRALLPLVMYAYFRPDDKDVNELIIENARSWRDITMEAVDGKPAGITPLMLKWGRQLLKEPKGTSLSIKTDWVYPGYLSFEYPSGYTNHIYDLCLAAFYLSGDKSFLDPHKEALKLLGTLGEGGIKAAGSSGTMTTFQGAQGTGDYDATKHPRGSLEWAVRMNRAGLGMAGAQYRAATGDTSFDETLLKHGPAYTQFVIRAERAKTPEQMAAATKALKPMFDDILNTLDYNEVLRTELPQSTDRVWVPGMDFLESTATGDISAAPPPALRGEEEFWPMFGATWKKTGTDVAMLVKTNTSSRFEAYLYNFLDAAKAIEAHIWMLAPGKYQVRLMPSPDFKDEAGGTTADFEMKQKGQLLKLDVPPQKQYHLVIEPMAKA